MEGMKKVTLSRQQKTDLIILAAELLKMARADQMLRESAGTVGPDKTYPAKQKEVDFLADPARRNDCLL